MSDDPGRPRSTARARRDEGSTRRLDAPRTSSSCPLQSARSLYSLIASRRSLTRVQIWAGDLWWALLQACRCSWPCGLARTESQPGFVDDLIRLIAVHAAQQPRGKRSSARPILDTPAPGGPRAMADDDEGLYDELYGDDDDDVPMAPPQIIPPEEPAPEEPTPAPEEPAPVAANAPGDGDGRRSGGRRAVSHAREGQARRQAARGDRPRVRRDPVRER